MSKIRLAFLGFRHGHVMGLYKSAKAHPRVEVVAACEEDDATAKTLRDAGTVQLTHGSYDDVYSSVDFDAVAVGDYFARRGELILSALNAGKHVIADKPICTDLAQLDAIEKLAAQKRRVVGCLLDLRDHGAYIAVRKLIKEGAIGNVHTVTFLAQHPLILGKRPAWYFEPGKHGGTINDIGVHAIDLIPWMTGRKLVEVTSARAWNARVPQSPQFQDAAQFCLKLDNGGSVFGDVSYLNPDGAMYSPMQYWRMTIHGETGMIETSYNAKSVELTKATDATPQNIPLADAKPTGCLDAFLNEIEGNNPPGELTSRDVFDAARKSLLTQRAADQQKAFVAL